MDLIDKQIHGDEFRLRILLTNDCNLKCNNCLNDFQKKGHDFIDIDIVKKVLSDYNTFCWFVGINNPVVSFSGGEPGLHPMFPEIMDYVKKFEDFKIQLNTNGEVDKRSWNSDRVDIRYHIGSGFDNNITKDQTAVIIIKEDYEVNTTLIPFLYPFYKGGMKIKSFVDYYSEPFFKKSEYPRILKELNKTIPVSGRFTGVQENRGKGCDDCKKNCVTLKALWVFPNGKCSPCPQSDGVEYTEKEILKAYKFHLRKE